ncbi:G-protein coupled receptor Mth2 [Orussus abietinus]|uniref:G-protein coupled receptor Mth2 n=1 Tax=Orussus abietinus TaxID=222816 RepID=UPI000626CAD5|nr:G-protein coupled receptor Mth2 [Orussus abietinus]
MFRIAAIVALLFSARDADSSYLFIKCCEDGYVLDEEFNCSRPVNGTPGSEVRILPNETSSMHLTCHKNAEVGPPAAIDSGPDSTNDVICQDVNANGSLVTGVCREISKNAIDEQCDGLLTPLKFWGATIVVFANLIYAVPYFLVIVLFVFVPDLRNRAYDKAVLCFNVCQLLTVAILSVMGYFVLCHMSVGTAYYVLAGLSLMFLTISSVVWISVLCFDMTLVITRLRWVHAGNKDLEEKRKFRVYSAWAWGTAIVPTSIACLLELSPLLPTESLVRPNFVRFDDGANVAVIVYVITFPVITFIANNALFMYTTYKVIRMKRSAALALENRTEKATKKYFVFLRLYLLMDAPWLTGALGAIFEDLWILKLFRITQPILMALAILPQKKVRRAFACSKNTNNDNRIPTNVVNPNTSNVNEFVTNC